MPASAEAVIALFYAVSAVAVSSVGIPQTLSLWKRRHDHDGLQRFRALWVLLMGALCMGTLYRAAVWVDLAVFDQWWMGPIAQRWPIEVAISWMVMLASLFAAGLYWVTRKDQRP